MSKYVPNLLPNQSRFEIGNETISDKKKNSNNGNKVLQTISYILAIIFLIASLTLIFTRFWEGFLFLIIGLIILPNGHNWIERKLRFKFKILPKTIICITLFIFAVIIGANYEKNENEKNEKERIENEKEQTANKETELIDKLRVDSLSMFQNSSVDLINQNKLKEAFISIKIALTLSKTDYEKTKSNSIYANYLLKSNKFVDAIPEFTSSINNNYNLCDALYKRAICYQKTKKIQEAVNDLREAIKHGNDEAKPLYEKLNPIKKKLIGYTTLCCDGTTSSSRGRGACSHHNGVCDWNHPIYEEYRQY